MSVFGRHPAARWGAPVAVVAVALGGGLLTRATAGADESLPPRTAAQLLVDLQTARLDAGSGTITQKADLGLPALPSIGGSGSADLTSLVSGNHTLRVWYSGPAKERLSLLGTLGESDVIRNGNDAWVWSSNANTATHYRLPADAPAGAPKAIDPAQTPQQAADQALAAIDPSTTVTTEGTARIAGRSAYELVLSPKDTASLVGQVRIAIDAVEHVPLRVQVLARGATDPAVEIGFTQVSFDRPSNAQFAFTPPPGTTVKQGELPMDSGRPQAKAKAQQLGADGKPQLTGTGWTTVAEFRAPVAALAQAGGQQGALLKALPTVSGSWGSGRLLTGTLFSVLLTDDGRVFAGAVAPARLYQAAGAK